MNQFLDLLTIIRAAKRPGFIDSGARGKAALDERNFCFFSHERKLLLTPTWQRFVAPHICRPRHCSRWRPKPRILSESHVIAAIRCVSCCKFVLIWLYSPQSRVDCRVVVPRRPWTSRRCLQSALIIQVISWSRYPSLDAVLNYWKSCVTRFSWTFLAIPRIL